jgi:hypothetical protein
MLQAANSSSDGPLALVQVMKLRQRELYHFIEPGPKGDRDGAVVRIGGDHSVDEEVHNFQGCPAVLV